MLLELECDGGIQQGIRAGRLRLVAIDGLRRPGGWRQGPILSLSLGPCTGLGPCGGLGRWPLSGLAAAGLGTLNCLAAVGLGMMRAAGLLALPRLNTPAL